MKECKWRAPVEQNNQNDENNKNVNKAFQKAVVDTVPGIVAVKVLGSLQQQFCNGLCKLLTANDIGPVECRRPEHSEETCPDIASYRLRQQLF